MYLSCMYVGGVDLYDICVCAGTHEYVCTWHVYAKKKQNNKQVYVSFLRSCVLCLVETGSFVWPGACWIGKAHCPLNVWEFSILNHHVQHFQMYFGDQTQVLLLVWGSPSQVNSLLPWTSYFYLVKGRDEELFQISTS